MCETSRSFFFPLSFSKPAMGLFTSLFLCLSLSVTHSLISFYSTILTHCQTNTLLLSTPPKQKPAHTHTQGLQLVAVLSQCCFLNEPEYLYLTANTGPPSHFTCTLFDRDGAHQQQNDFFHLIAIKRNKKTS